MKEMKAKSILLLFLLSTTVYSQYEFYGAYDVFYKKMIGGSSGNTWFDKSINYFKPNPGIQRGEEVYTHNFLVNLFYNKETIKYDSDSNAITIDIRLEPHSLVSHIGDLNTYFQIGVDFTIRYLIDKSKCWAILGNDSYFREMGGIYKKLCEEKSKDFLKSK